MDSPDKGKVTTAGLKSVEGDSFLNIRRNKLVASYELDIKVAWCGTGAEGEEASGTIQLPYLAEENHDEDPEIKVICDVENKASNALKSAILSDGKKVSRTFDCQQTYHWRTSLIGVQCPWHDSNQIFSV